MSENHTRRRRMSVAMFAMAASAGLVMLGTPAQAYECKSTYTIVGANAVLQLTAKAKARAAWSATVKNKYSLSWSVWDIAASRSQPCSLAAGKWVCQAKAKPCNYVVP
jgi:hypothetical protein